MGTLLDIFALQIPVHEDPEIQQNLAEGIVGQKALMHMLLLADDLLDRDPVPGLDAGLPVHGVAAGAPAQLHQKQPLRAFASVDTKSLVGVRGNVEPAPPDELLDLVEILDNGRPAYEECLCDRRERDKSRGIDEENRRDLDPLLLRELVVVKIAFADQGQQLSEIVSDLIRPLLSSSRASSPLSESASFIAFRSLRTVRWETENSSARLSIVNFSSGFSLSLRIIETVRFFIDPPPMRDPQIVLIFRRIGLILRKADPVISASVFSRRHACLFFKTFEK